MDAVRASLGEGSAGLTLSTRLEIGSGIGAVDGLGEYTCGTGFAHTSGTAEQIRVGKGAATYGVLEHTGDIVLPYERREAVGTVLSG